MTIKVKGITYTIIAYSLISMAHVNSKVTPTNNAAI